MLITGNPFPNVSEVVYYYNNVELTEEKSSEFGVAFLNRQKILFGAVSYKHEGVYLVKVTTSAGTYNTSFTLHVAGMPNYLNLLFCGLVSLLLFTSCHNHCLSQY